MTEVKPHVFKPNELQLAEMIRPVYHLFVPDSTTLEQILSPKSYVHISKKLPAMTQIEVMSESGSFYARLMVRSVLKSGEVVVALMDKYEWKSNPQDNADPDYEVKFISNRYKWGVQRKVDGEYVYKDIQTEEEALRALADHRKALAA